MGGKSGGGSVTIGYWYKLGVQMVVCHAPVDKVSEIIIGERQAWQGSVTQSSSITINKLDLFGGDDREGGVAGNISFMFGEPTQKPHEYVLAMRGDKVSANRGLLSMVFGRGVINSGVETIDWTKAALTSAIRSKLTNTYGIQSDINSVYSAPESSGGKQSCLRVLRKVGGNTAERRGQTILYPPNQLGYQDRPNSSGVDAAYVMNMILHDILTAGTQITARTPPADDYPTQWAGRFIYRGVKYKSSDVVDPSTIVKDPARTRTNPFTWTAMNPYFKALWVRVTNITAGWSTGAAWYPAKAKIGEWDMNPAHIVYRVITDSNWGMGYDPAMIDDVAFKAAADVLYDEKFGLSLAWAREVEIGEFLQTVIQHIDANLKIDMYTGKFQLQLIRQVPDDANMVVLNESNIIEFLNYSRATWGDSPNEIVLTYKDRNEDNAVVTVQNLAAIESQGGIISRGVTFNGIHEPELALKVAQRELNLNSTPMSTIQLKTNRVLWSKNIGDVFALEWPLLGISRMIYRITKINVGQMLDGVITVDAVEDVFHMPSTSYAQVQDSTWVDPTTAPRPIAVQTAQEASYWEVVRTLGERGVALLQQDEAFLRLLAETPQSDASGFELHASPNNAIATYQKVGTFRFVPQAYLMQDLAYLDTVVKVDFIDEVAFKRLTKPYLIVDGEEMVVQNYDAVAMTFTVGRGVNDTTPTRHGYMTSVYMVDAGSPALDLTERVIGDTVYYRGLPKTAKGTLALADATASMAQLTGRMWKPYVVGNVKINAAYYPDTIPATANLFVSWANRNRLTQTTEMLVFQYGNIAPETGQNVMIEVYNEAGTLLKSVEGNATNTWTWTTELTDAPYYPTVNGRFWYDSRVPPLTARLNPYLRVVIYTMRDGLKSHQQYEHVVRRIFTDIPSGDSLYGSSGYDFNYGDD